MSFSFLRWSLSALLLGAAAIAVAQTGPEDDSKIVGEARQRIRALQRHAAETQDPAAIAQLHAQMDEVIEAAIARASPRARPMVEVGLKLMRPLLEDSAAYTEASRAFFESPAGDPSTIKAREEVAARIGEIEKLKRQNQKLVDRINAMESEVEKLIKKSDVTAEQRAAFLSGYQRSSSRNLGALRAIRSLDAKVLDLWIELLRLMNTEWGRWRPGEADALQWDDAKAQAKAAQIVKEMNVLADRQLAAQRVLVGGN